MEYQKAEKRKMLETILVKFKKYSLEVAIILLLILMYYKPLLSSVLEWLNPDSFYSYGLFLPLFLVLYYKKNSKKFKETYKISSNLGFLSLIPGIAFYFVGIRIEYQFLINLSFIMILAGIILLIWGRKVFIDCILPLFIVSMCLPFFSIIRLTVPMQIFFSKSTALLLHALGVKAVNIGSTVYMNGYSISVAPGCSGLKSLLNLTVLGLMYSYFINTSLIKKTLFILSSFPISFITNILRISLSGFYVIFNGYKGFETFHFLLGLVFYIIGMFLMLFISNYIEEPMCNE